jgi:hypothetical protein
LTVDDDGTPQLQESIIQAGPLDSKVGEAISISAP